MPRSGPLRIAMLVHNVYERDARVRRYSEYLAREGHRVDLICLMPEAGEPPTSQCANIKVYTLPLRRVRREGLGQIVEWAFSLVAMFLMISVLDRRHPYDLVHTHNMPDLIVFCALLPRLRGCPVILDLHDPMPEIAASKFTMAKNHPVIKLHHLIETVSTKFSNRIITSTVSFKKLLVARGAPPDKIAVVVNSADPLIFSSHADIHIRETGQQNFDLLYVGTVAARYGLGVCVRALPSLRHEVPGIRLMIVPKVRGEGAALRELLNQARGLGVEDMIQVKNPVPLERMPEIMEKADLGIYPAIRDAHMDLALSLKIPEMAAVGLPMVATRLAVLDELFGEDSIAFVPSGDVTAFVEMVSALYRSPQARHRLAVNARGQAGALSWPRQYQVYKEVLEGLL